MAFRVGVLVFVAAALVGGLVIWLSNRGADPWAESVGAIDRSGNGRRGEEGGENSPEQTKARPKVVVEETTHNFGNLDPTQKCEHVFFVRNEGEAPLQLSRGATSCKCTMSDLPEGPIPPGAGAPVRVASKIVQTSGKFSHRATVFTNDPENASITLCIEGCVRQHVAADPPRIVVAGMRREESKSIPVVVYSQVWGHFDLDDLTSTLDGLTWSVGPADPDALAKLDARCGYRLDVTLPTDLPGGDFWEQIQMLITPVDDVDPPRTIAVDVTGKVLSRISIDGPKIDGRRVLRLGVLRGGEGARERLTMKIRDNHRELVIERIDTRPDFLRVSVAPHGPEAAKLGLYRIDVEVPKNAPMSDFLASKGEIRIQTDHPAVPMLTLEVAFAVLGR